MRLNFEIAIFGLLFVITHQQPPYPQNNVNYQTENNDTENNQQNSYHTKRSRDPLKREARQIVRKWYQFKKDYGKVYKSQDEENLRFAIFIKNLEKIDAMNKENIYYKTGINQFTDLTLNEFQSTYLASGPVYSPPRRQNQTYVKKLSRRRAPDRFDWREHGFNTRVKNQGGCASCWAFAATGAIEAQIFILTGKIVTLSEQQLMDCTKAYHNFGCNTGSINMAFQYIMENDGIIFERDYPYEESDKECRTGNKTRIVTLSDYVEIEVGNEELLKEAVAFHGPVAISLRATGDRFQSYCGGVLIDDSCTSSSGTLNHAMLLIGYGSELIHDVQVDYWIIKNQYSSAWGENGYIRMARNFNNMCGVATAASYAVLKDSDFLVDFI